MFCLPPRHCAATTSSHASQICFKHNVLIPSLYSTPSLHSYHYLLAHSCTPTMPVATRGARFHLPPSVFKENDLVIDIPAPAKCQHPSIQERYSDHIDEDRFKRHRKVPSANLWCGQIPVSRLRGLSVLFPGSRPRSNCCRRCLRHVRSQPLAWGSEATEEDKATATQSREIYRYAK